MTRLKEEDVSPIAASLIDYDLDLGRRTGSSLKEIAARAVGREISVLNKLQPKIAIIPMTCGQGIIGGFVESVASIINHLGYKATVTKNSDAGGLAEAVQNGAEIVFMADDDRFVAVNLKAGKISDNGEATGKGYVAGLECMCSGLDGKKVLLIGAGPVGTGAAIALARFGAEISVFDINPESSQRLAAILEELGCHIKLETNFDEALELNHILVDACPAGEIISLRYINEDTVIAAPGIPLGVGVEGAKKLSDRLLHDPLQIGVATMLFDVL